MSNSNPDNPALSPLLQARDICFTRDGRRILDHIDFSLARGEIVTLMGLNGSGKTTLVKVLAGLLRPDSGVVTRAPGLRLGYCPQRVAVDGTIPMTARGFLSLTAAGGTVLPALRRVGIAALADRRLAELSGGEFQRLLLARAILRKPDALILDEPMAGVDVAGQGELYELIPKLRDEYHCGVILVSHDIHVVMAATDRVLCVNHHICCSGRPETVAAHPEFVELFGDRAAKTLAVYKHRHNHSHDLHGDAHGDAHGDTYVDTHVDAHDATHARPDHARCERP